MYSTQQGHHLLCTHGLTSDMQRFTRQALSTQTMRLKAVALPGQEVIAAHSAMSCDMQRCAPLPVICLAASVVLSLADSYAC